MRRLRRLIAPEGLPMAGTTNYMPVLQIQVGNIGDGPDGKLTSSSIVPAGTIQGTPSQGHSERLDASMTHQEVIPTGDADLYRLSYEDWLRGVCVFQSRQGKDSCGLRDSTSLTQVAPLQVFSMLHVQAASENELRLDNDNISVIKFGERAFSQIRRFVIVEVRRGFVYAW